LCFGGDDKVNDKSGSFTLSSPGLFDDAINIHKPALASRLIAKSGVFNTIINLA
jgi:hypothetical protein